MNLNSFTENKAGELIKTFDGFWAFVPYPLPPQIEPSWELIENLSKAERALGELAGLARTLPNPHLLIGSFVRREAVLSSRIEGTQAGLSELFFFEASGEPPQETDDVIEISNYINALNFGLERIESLPISLRLIREIHERLMAGARGKDKTPGEFRTKQNWIGPHGCDLPNATYVPPPILQMNSALNALELYLHADSHIHILIRLALIHYQFEAIHPFLDGNGRVGRLLITLLLVSQNLLPQPLLYLSAFFERHRETYYDHLLAISQQGAWNEWISFFLRGVAEQAKDALVRSGELIDLWRRYTNQLQSVRSSSLQLKLLDRLFFLPAITYKQAEKILNVTPRASNLNVNKLIENKILVEIPGRQRNRIFIAPEIIEIIKK